MRIKITAKNIVWDTDGEKVKLPKSFSFEIDITANDVLSKDGVCFDDIDDTTGTKLCDKFGYGVKSYDISYKEIPIVTHAAVKFLKAEAAKILNKAIAFRAKPECDASAWLKWLDKNINAKGYVLNFNSTTGEPISISTQNLAFA